MKLQIRKSEDSRGGKAVFHEKGVRRIDFIVLLFWFSVASDRLLSIIALVYLFLFLFSIGA